MVAKDIIRIALFVLFALFAIAAATRKRYRGTVETNRDEENRSAETQHVMPHSEITREIIR